MAATATAARRLTSEHAGHGRMEIVDLLQAVEEGATFLGDGSAHRRVDGPRGYRLAAESTQELSRPKKQ